MAGIAAQRLSSPIGFVIHFLAKRFATSADDPWGSWTTKIKLQIFKGVPVEVLLTSDRFSE